MTITSLSDAGSAPPVPPDRLPRLLPPDPSARPDLEAHVSRLGGSPLGQSWLTRQTLIEAVRRSGLRGRGGAGFPTAVKLAAVAAGRKPVVVANGCEGEPASAKDRTLLAASPHLVLDGAVLAAWAVGATEVILCLDRQATATHRHVLTALAERQARHLDPVPIRVETPPSRYIAGEESALVHWLNGGEAKPTFTPPRPFERGVGGRPTLIQNVETLAHLALIARFGDRWFQALGTADEPGSLLVTLSGAFGRPGVLESALGTPLDVLLRAAEQHQPAAQPTPLLVGGYFGRWLPAPAVSWLAMANQSLATVGASIGAGVVVVLPADACGLVETARVVRWLASETAGQCGPCVFGLAAIAGGLEDLVWGRHAQRTLADLRRWLTQVRGRGACHHPDGAARLVESCLDTFEAEIVAHAHHGGCPALNLPPVLPIPNHPEQWR
jgi:NADH:ubiquinone oxidoreductase subunit F (NADH-binding)